MTCCFLSDTGCHYIIPTYLGDENYLTILCLNQFVTPYCLTPKPA